jgi:cyclopropane fatty-acyl-phospholipid synthase-like methyltransferase
LNLIARNDLEFKTICEVGCGAGQIINYLHNYFPETIFFGYEISEDAYKMAKSLENNRLKYYNHDLFVENVYYDVLLIMDVVEHVKDYFGFVEKCYKSANYKIFHFPLDMSILSIIRNDIMRDRNKLGHLHYFSKDTVLATLKESNHEIIDWFYTPGIEINNQTFSQKFLNFFRKILFKINKDFAVKTLSGYSIIVLTK